MKLSPEPEPVVNPPDALSSVRALSEQGAITSLEYHFAALMHQLDPSASEGVLLAAALVCRAVNEGHICLRLATCRHTVLLDDEARPIDDFSWPHLETWLKELGACPLVSDGGRSTPLVLTESGQLYLFRYFDLEQKLARCLVSRLRTRSFDAQVLRRGLQRLFGPHPDPNDYQMVAAVAAATTDLTLICGGPGTGKTTTVAKLLVLLAEQAEHELGASARKSNAGSGEKPLLRALLIAPTGKAAQRLLESSRATLEQLVTLSAAAKGIDLHASTIHRALEYRSSTPTHFGRSAQHPLWADVIIVDEASMIDLALMTRLLTAISTESRIVLLGDKDQLASVQAGSTFGDICSPGLERGPSKAFRARIQALVTPATSTERAPSGQRVPLEDCIVQLVRSFRYDARGGIGRLATCINQGKADEAVALLASGSSEVRFHELEGSRRDYSERLAALLTPEVRRAYGAYLATQDPAAKLSELQRFRVLVAHRLGRFGQESLNQIVETSLESLGLTPQGSHYHGQPVIIAQNDYQLGIYNGDIGVVLLDEAGHFQTWIATARGLSVIPASRLPQFATAFAMTVHKSQGSEFDEVFLVLPDAESPLLTRELLYTAITRAKSTVHLVGSTRALRAAIARRVERTSGLRSLLWPEP